MSYLDISMTFYYQTCSTFDVSKTPRVAKTSQELTEEILEAGNPTYLRVLRDRATGCFGFAKWE